MKKRIGIVCSLLPPLLFVSCITRQVQLNNSHNSQKYIERFIRDSMLIRDSIYVKETPDTVYKTQWRTVFRDRVRTDTLFVKDTLYKEKQFDEPVSYSNATGKGWGRLFGFAVALFVAIILWRCGIFDLVSHIVKMIIKP